MINIPLYPNGELVSFTQARLRSDNDLLVMSFRTSDSSNIVKDFYRATLSLHGWQIQEVKPMFGSEREGVQWQIRFIYTRGCPSYQFDVYTRMESGLTFVYTERLETLCR